MVKGKIEPTTLYGELALDAAGRSDRAQAKHWLDRGVESEPPLKRSANALAWEMIDLQVQMVLDEPEVWVPSLAVILESVSRKSGGDVSGIPSPDQSRARPGRTGPQSSRSSGARHARAGALSQSIWPPRTTASGQLGVAATRGEIWTPESAAAGRRRRLPIWTPGSATPPAAGQEENHPIIVTGH